MNQKIKDGIFFGIAFSLTSLLIFSMSAFAYSKIETVKSGDVLSADSYNELVNTLNEYGDSIKDLQAQNEGIYQNAFDTNEIWTGKYDALTGKKIYSRWYHYGDVFGNLGHRITEHGIEGIDKVIYTEDFFRKEATGYTFSNRPHNGIQVSSKNIDLYLTATRGNDVWDFWFRLEYTKIDD